MAKADRYARVDLPFYRQHIAPVLPPAVLDFHVHTWERDQRTEARADSAGAQYVVTEHEYPVERLLADAVRLFPDRPYSAMCFGWPGPASDLEKTNADVPSLARRRGLFPLLLAGHGLVPRSELERGVHEHGAFGYKVRIPWQGNDYGSVTVADMIGPEEMRLADELGLIVLLHVPGAGRLGDPQVQAGVRDLAQRHPSARIVLAHCGRCYLPDEMARAVGSVADLDNVYLDTAMLMDPTVFEIVFEQMDSRRVLFATDLPIALMRGRRVYVMDHWVDLVSPGWPSSAFRIASDNFRATFMVYEIILSLRRAAERAGLTDQRTLALFHDNGQAVLRHVMGGKQYEAAQRRWASQ
jgi:uncharacterized protein